MAPNLEGTLTKRDWLQALRQIESAYCPIQTVFNSTNSAISYPYFSGLKRLCSNIRATQQQLDTAVLTLSRK